MCRVEKLLINNAVRRLLWKKKEFPIIRWMIRPKPGMRTLEIGAGMGIGTASLLAAFPEIVESTVTDIDLAQLAKAKRYLPSRTPETVNLNFQQADAANLPFPPDRFDLVCAFGMLHHVPQYERAIAECARVLCPGGQFAMLDPTRRTFRWVGWLFPPACAFTMDDAVDAVQAGGLAVTRTHNSGGWFLYVSAGKPVGAWPKRGDGDE
jgi:ubiquinone/menaquinone biosynthesis C-methylase UbiE